jgi:hypothetical protein
MSAVPARARRLAAWRCAANCTNTAERAECDERADGKVRALERFGARTLTMRQLLFCWHSLPGVDGGNARHGATQGLRRRHGCSLGTATGRRTARLTARRWRTVEPARVAATRTACTTGREQGGREGKPRKHTAKTHGHLSSELGITASSAPPIRIRTGWRTRRFACRRSLGVAPRMPRLHLTVKH